MKKEDIENKPLTQEHIDEVLQYCNSVVKLAWKQEYARHKRMFPNFKWTEGLFDRYIDSLAEQYAHDGYEPIDAQEYLKMTPEQQEEIKKNPPRVKNIKNPSQVARREKEKSSKTTKKPTQMIR